MSDSIVKIKDFNISSIGFSNPMKRNNGYGCKLIYDGNDFRFQLPLAIVNDVDLDGDKPTITVNFKLSDNFDYFQFFCIINELVVKHLGRYATNPNYDILKDTDGSQEEIRDVFYTNINKVDGTDIKCVLKVNKSSLYFDNKKSEISGYEIKPGDKVVCMVKTNGLVVDNKSSGLHWICTQCLKWK